MAHVIIGRIPATVFYVKEPQRREWGLSGYVNRWLFQCAQREGKPVNGKTNRAKNDFTITVADARSILSKLEIAAKTVLGFPSKLSPFCMFGKYRFQMSNNLYAPEFLAHKPGALREKSSSTERFS